MFQQFLAVCSVLLTGLRSQAGNSFVAVVGIAGVVGVLVTVLAMGLSYQAMLSGTGHADRAIVLAKGAFENSSSLSRDAASALASSPGIQEAADGNPLLSMEVLSQLRLPDNAGRMTSVALRGVGPKAEQLRPEIRVLHGRMFHRGLREFIVGRTIQAQVKGLRVGDRLVFQDALWTIVGDFSGGQGGSAHESEIFGDAEVLMSSLHRTVFQSVTVKLVSPASLKTLASHLEANPSLSMEVDREDAYYAERSRTIALIFTSVGTFVGGIMAIGASFAAANTMYAATASQLRLIATLRAIGFRAVSILGAVLLQSVLLAALGAILGAGLAVLIFNGHVLRVAPGGQSQMLFALQITPLLAIRGGIWAILIGFLGGLLPALRAAKMSVAEALRIA